MLVILLVLLLVRVGLVVQISFFEVVSARGEARRIDGGDFPGAPYMLDFLLVGWKWVLIMLQVFLISPNLLFRSTHRPRNLSLTYKGTDGYAHTVIALSQNVCNIRRSW